MSSSSRTLSFAALVGSVAALCIGACSSFDDAADPKATDAASDAATSDGDAAPGDGASTGDAPTAGDGAVPYCATPIASVSANFDKGKSVLMFEEVPSPTGATITWNQTGGVNGTGALETTTSGAATQAQIERDFPLAGAKRARLSFSANILSPATSGRVVFGCTLQLITLPIDAGVNTYVETFFLLKDSSLRFDQDANASGSGIQSFTIDDAPSGWRTYALEMTDIGPGSVRYKAFYGTQEVTPPGSAVSLQTAPDHFHVKCGIDDTDIPADVLVDDVSFEMCTP